MENERFGVQLYRVGEDGTERRVSMSVILDSIPAPILEMLVSHSLDRSTPQEQVDAFGLVLSRIVKDEPGTLRLYAVHKTLDPELADCEPREKSLAYEFPLRTAKDEMIAIRPELETRLR